MLNEKENQNSNQKSLNFTTTKAVEQIEEIKTHLNTPKNANLVILVKNLTKQITPKDKEIKKLKEKQKNKQTNKKQQIIMKA